MEDNKCITQFVYQYNGPKSDEIRVTGSINELGNWDINRAVRLNYSPNDDLYKSKENVILLKWNNLEYKYIVFRSGSLYKWEDLPNNGNRKFDTKNNSNSILFD